MLEKINYEEIYARDHRIPEMIDLEEHFAKVALETTCNTSMPDRAKREVISSAKYLKICLSKLREHLARNEINQAIMTALDIGKTSQMIVRNGWTHLVVAANKSRVDRAEARSAWSENAAKRRKQIIAAVQKQLNDNPADNLGFAQECVYQEIAESFAKRGENVPRGYSLPTIKRYTNGVVKKKKSKKTNQKKRNLPD
jgi:hypothetical protein